MKIVLVDFYIANRLINGIYLPTGKQLPNYCRAVTINRIKERCRVSLSLQSTLTEVAFLAIFSCHTTSFSWVYTARFSAEFAGSHDNLPV